MKVRTIYQLAEQRLRQCPGFDAAALFRELERSHRRAIVDRINQTMTPHWLARESSGQRFAAFVALPSRLRNEASKVAAIVPARPVKAKSRYEVARDWLTSLRVNKPIARATQPQ